MGSGRESGKIKHEETNGEYLKIPSGHRDINRDKSEVWVKPCSCTSRVGQINTIQVLMGPYLYPWVGAFRDTVYTYL